MKVKVEFGTTRLVIPCGDSQDLVLRLINTINKRLQSHLGDSSVRVKELTTADGFLINPHDPIGEVIEDGQILRALDYKTWLAQHLPLLEKPWHEVTRADYAAEGNPYRGVAVGLHKHRKLYIKLLSTYKEVERLELFDIETLSNFGKGGATALIARKEVKDPKARLEWFVEANLIVESSGVASGVELQVKSSSDDRPQVERVTFKYDPELAKGDVQVLQKADPPKPNKVYELPPPKVHGPKFDPEHVIPVHAEKHEEPKVEDNKAVGDIELEIRQKDPIQADQRWARSDSSNEYTNVFFNHLSIFNPTEKQIVIVKVISEYEKDGSWIPTPLRLGTKGGYYNYSMGRYNPDEGFNVGPDERLNLATETAIQVNAPQFDRMRRAHRSLPSPLRIRLTFVSKDGHKSELISEYHNPPIAVRTKETCQEKRQLPVYAYVSADDLETETNIWFEAFHVPERDSYGGPRLELATPSGNRYIYRNTLRHYLYQAKTTQKSEILIEELSPDQMASKGYKTQVYALVDLDAQYVYAFRV